MILFLCTFTNYSETAFFILRRKEKTEMNLKMIKKALMQGRIRLTKHVLEQMDKRGYTKSDVLACIMSGERTSIQPYRYSKKVSAVIVIEGVDQDGLPMVVVVGHDFSAKALFAVVTAMPPIDEKYQRVI